MSLNTVLSNSQQWHIQQGDVLDVLRQIPDGVVQCVVTSPPYWGLRDYGTAEWEGGNPNCDHRQEAIRIRRNLAEAANACDGGNRKAENRSDKDVLGLPYRNVCAKCGARRIDQQIGLEDTPEEYVARLVEVFREVRRVLRDDGVLWVNLGDSYAGSMKGIGADGTAYAGPKQATNQGSVGIFHDRPPTAGAIGLKPKDLVGIPWRVAFALQADGWWLRSDVIWHKPNCMPESVTDRPTKAHEYVFLLTKSARYFYDNEAIKTPAKTTTVKRATGGTWHNMEERPDVGYPGQASRNKAAINRDVRAKLLEGGELRVNARSVWVIPTKSYGGAHFATFPPELPEVCIKASTSERGCCPKCGAPWERVVEKTRTFESGSGRSGNMPTGKNGAGLQGGGETLDIRRGPCVTSTTIDWRPTCTCDAGEPVPCIVLDPFSGAGTTLMVALRLGRRALGIELNGEYVAMAERRIVGDCPLFSMAIEGAAR
jgi:DNA modification methylase